MLILLIVIGASGMLMTFTIYYPDMGLVYSFAEGLVTLNWSELPSELIFLAHIFLAFTLIAIFPISKLLHSPGVFFSPTLNQVDMPVRGDIFRLGLCKKKQKRKFS